MTTTPGEHESLIGRLRRLGALLEPESNPGGVVYGVLAIGTLLAAEGARRETYPAVLEASGLALVLYWLAHAYSGYFGDRAESGAAFSPRRFLHAVAHEAALLKGAVLPVAALLVAWVFRSPLSLAVTIALWTAALELVLLEVAVGVRRKLSVVELAFELSLGLLLAGGILGVRLLLH